MSADESRSDSRVEQAVAGQERQQPRRTSRQEHVEQILDDEPPCEQATDGAGAVLGDHSDAQTPLGMSAMTAPAKPAHTPTSIAPADASR